MKKTKAIFYQPIKILTSVEEYDGMFTKERMISFIPPENSYIEFGKDSWHAWFSIQVDKVYLNIGESGDEIVNMIIYCKPLIDDRSSRGDVHRSDKEYRKILEEESLAKGGWTLRQE